ncbi:MAG: trigger factor [Actinomycetota bacterium]|nr:trigger factor [Actinomycetota bacterium]
MDYKILDVKKEKDKVTLNLEIQGKYFNKALGKAYKNISQKANIPGFRKGKVPYQVIDTNFGRQYVLNKAASISVSELYPQIIDNANIDPIDYPGVKFKEIADGKPLGVEITIPVEPEIKAPGYDKLEVTAKPAEVTQEEIDSYIDRIREKYSSLEPVDGDDPAKDGDYVTIDFEGMVEGQELEDGKSEDFVLEIGSKTLTPEFEKSIIGMKKGEEKTVEFTLPDNIRRNDLAGKKAEFKVKLKEIKKKVVPEVDKEFLKEAGDYQDKKEFEQEIKKDLSQQKEQARKEEILGQVIEQLIERADIKAPAAMVRNRTEQMKSEFENTLKNQKINKKNYLQATGMDETVLEQQFAQRAEAEIKQYLLFKALEKAEKDKIEPKEEDVKKEADQIIANYSKEEEKKKIEDYLQTPEGKENLLSSIRRRNLMDKLIGSAKVVDKKKESPKKEKKTEEKQGGQTKKLWTPGQK